MSFELPDPPRDEDAFAPYPPEVCSFIRRCLFRRWRWERVTQEWTGWRWRTTSREVLPRVAE